MTTASASRGAVGQRRRSACGSASIPGRRPVSLRSYWEAVKAQAAKPEVNRQVLQVAFSDMVTSESLLDQLVRSGADRAFFNFSVCPPGNDKTSIAERLLRVYQDAILIP